MLRRGAWLSRTAVAAVWLAGCLAGGALSQISGYAATARTSRADNRVAELGQSSIVEVLSGRGPEQIVVERDPATGRVESLWGPLGKVRPEGQARGEALDLEAEARQLLSAQGALLRGRAPAPDLVLKDVVQGQAGDHARFVQEVQGIPVYGSWVSVHMDKDGEARSVQYRTFDDVGTRGAPTPRVTADEAVEVGRRAVAASGEVRLGIPPRLVWYPQNGSLALSWQVSLPIRAPIASWLVIVDADTGAVLYKADMLWRGPNTGSGWVFDPNPVVQLGTRSLRDAGDADSPELDAAKIAVKLPRLDGSGYLDGDYVSTKLTDTFERARSPKWEFQYPRSDPRFGEVMAYYHIDRLQAYFEEVLKVSKAGNRPQLVAVDAFEDDQSCYDPETKGIYLGSGGVDDAEDADVIIHEYGHAVLEAQVPGFGMPKDDQTWPHEAHALSEGFADYLAARASVLSGVDYAPEVIGDWDSVETGGIRRVGTDRRYAFDLVRECHADGEIWASVLWDIAQVLGWQQADRLVLESHYLLTPDARFQTAAKALLEADRALQKAGLFGERHEAVLEQIFASHGLPWFGPPAIYVAVDHERLSDLTVRVGIGDAAKPVRVFDLWSRQPTREELLVSFSGYPWPEGWDEMEQPDSQVSALEEDSPSVGTPKLRHGRLTAVFQIPPALLSQYPMATNKWFVEIRDSAPKDSGWFQSVIFWDGTNWWYGPQALPSEPGMLVLPDIWAKVDDASPQVRYTKPRQ